MESTFLDRQSQGIRTVLHMSPAVMAAAVVSAQRNELSLQEWLDRVVASLVADDESERAAPWSLQSADLFAWVASCSPEVLHGRWALMFEHVLLERDLWYQPEPTPENIAEDELPEAPYIVPARLRKAWPRLVATVFVL
ncbi:hypothetical protein VSR82_32790 [Burkholderia sp. JPY481]